MQDAEGKIGTKMNASFKQPKSHPVDYWVPNHGDVDSDIVISLGNLKQTEGLLGKWTVPTKAQVKAAQYPQDYAVPNFGVDSDIQQSLANTGSAEK